MRRAQPAGPYHLGGWSFGGVVAVEMARQLRAAGEEVALLAILDTKPVATAGEAPEAAAPAEDADSGFARFLGRAFALEPARFAGLDDEAQLAVVLDEARRAGVVTGHFGADEARRLFRVWKANFRARRAYRARPWPGRALYLRARDSFARGGDEDHGWRRLVADLDVRLVPGTHETMLLGENATSLAELLRTALEGDRR
jgi:thioesterase domain-containing protein